MDKGKINRIIIGNGLKPENFDRIEKDGGIYVIEDGVEFKLVGFNKTIVIPVKNLSKEEAKTAISDLMEKYNEEVEWDDFELGKNVDISEEDATFVWEPVKKDSDHEEVEVRTDEELERLKAIKKPRGWAFKKEYIDLEGNVYHLGKLV